jgi:aminoglycoside phosphotransferase (APT) family kinase protein
MFDPNKHRTECDKYLSAHLGVTVELQKATQLTKSTREAPWKLEVDIQGTKKSYVLQLEPNDLAYEYQVLKGLEEIPIPTPLVYGLDLKGEALGIPCFFSDFIEGESLLRPMLAGEPWAEDLYLDSVCELQSLTEAELGSLAGELNQETAKQFLEAAFSTLNNQSLPLVEATYQELVTSMPDLPPVRFSNGDLWLDNFIIKDKKLSGIIDFANACFSDPIYEFLLSFFVSPELQGRGIESRYCQRMGFDPALLDWYHGLEFFDTWHWVLVTGEAFVHHTDESLKADLRKWLERRCK